VPVIIRIHSEIKAAVEHHPFGEFDLKTDGSKYFLTLLSEVPNKDKCNALLALVKAPEKLVIDGMHLYIHYPNGAGRTKLTNTLIEKKLNVNATARNWKTMMKLIELSN